jgi:hypothetical protein
LRTTFANSYAEKATALANEQASTTTPQSSQQEKDAPVRSFQSSMRGFLTDVSFGVGRVWRANPASESASQTQRDPFEIFICEFFGSLLTGILVSIGAPYWHDILQALSSLRSVVPAAKAKT